MHVWYLQAACIYINVHVMWSTARSWLWALKSEDRNNLVWPWSAGPWSAPTFSLFRPQTRSIQEYSTAFAAASSLPSIIAAHGAPGTRLWMSVEKQLCREQLCTAFVMMSPLNAVLFSFACTTSYQEMGMAMLENFTNKQNEQYPMKRWWLMSLALQC